MSFRVRGFACLLLTVLPAVAVAADWPAFRGPEGRAVSEESNLPTKWSKSTGIKYKVDLPGRGLSNPVIADGRVYVTACTGYRERRLHVLCLKEATGEKLWERQFTATGNTACHPMTNMAAPTPVTDGKAVYALFATGDLAAIDKDGDLLWYRSLVGDYPDITNQVGMASSLALADKTLILPMENAGDSFAAGVDVATGKNLWKMKRERQINWASPLVFQSSGETLALLQTSSEATAVVPRTGAVRWTHKTRGMAGMASATAGQGFLFIPGGELRAFKLKGESAPDLEWKVSGVTQGYPSPVFYRGNVYGLTDVAATCFDGVTGKELWKERIDGPCAGSPVIGDNKLYAVNQKGKCCVVDLETRKVTRNDLDDTILATPAIANGCIYLRSDKHLYCIGKK